jgi:hypothetical protein
MAANDLLKQMTIPNPCSADWNQMRGDARTRYCESCGKHVYDLTAMDSVQAVSVLAGADAGKCVRVFERTDGTLTISDDFSLRAQPPGRWQFHIRAIMGLIAGVAGALGIARALAPADEPAAPAPAPVYGVTGGSIAPRQDPSFIHCQ